MSYAQTGPGDVWGPTDEDEGMTESEAQMLAEEEHCASPQRLLFWLEHELDDAAWNPVYVDHDAVRWSPAQCLVMLLCGQKDQIFRAAMELRDAFLAADKDEIAARAKEIMEDGDA